VLAEEHDESVGSLSEGSWRYRQVFSRSGCCARPQGGNQYRSGSNTTCSADGRTSTSGSTGADSNCPGSGQNRWRGSNRASTCTSDLATTGNSPRPHIMQQ
jgi:hypothetical protein